MKTIYEIKQDDLKCDVLEMRKGIYAVVIKDCYDRAMLFCRYQEFYESPYENINGKPFDIMSYMRTYKTKRDDKVFTYPNDWSGYNIPSHVLKSCLNNVFITHQRECGVNMYDYYMKDIVESINNHLGSDSIPFYILGVDTVDSHIMEHEIAHGLFYTDEKYKNNAIDNYNKLPENIKNGMRDILIQMGYCDDVIIDEIQAYMSTGLRDNMSNIENIESNISVFEKLFENYKI